MEVTGSGSVDAENVQVYGNGLMMAKLLFRKHFTWNRSLEPLKVGVPGRAPALYMEG
jgi:hypothetical protein